MRLSGILACTVLAAFVSRTHAGYIVTMPALPNLNTNTPLSDTCREFLKTDQIHKTCFFHPDTSSSRKLKFIFDRLCSKPFCEQKDVDDYAVKLLDACRSDIQRPSNVSVDEVDDLKVFYSWYTAFLKVNCYVDEDGEFVSYKTWKLKTVAEFGGPQPTEEQLCTEGNKYVMGTVMNAMESNPMKLQPWAKGPIAIRNFWRWRCGYEFMEDLRSSFGPPYPELQSKRPVALIAGDSAVSSNSDTQNADEESSNLTVNPSAVVVEMPADTQDGNKESLDLNDPMPIFVNIPAIPKFNTPIRETCKAFLDEDEIHKKCFFDPSATVYEELELKSNFVQMCSKRKECPQADVNEYAIKMIQACRTDIQPHPDVELDDYLNDLKIVFSWHTAFLNAYCYLEWDDEFVGYKMWMAHPRNIWGGPELTRNELCTGGNRYSVFKIVKAMEANPAKFNPWVNGPKNLKDFWKNRCGTDFLDEFYVNQYTYAEGHAKIMEASLKQNGRWFGIFGFAKKFLSVFSKSDTSNTDKFFDATEIGEGEKPDTQSIPADTVTDEEGLTESALDEKSDKAAPSNSNKAPVVMFDKGFPGYTINDEGGRTKALPENSKKAEPSNSNKAPVVTIDEGAVGIVDTIKDRTKALPEKSDKAEPSKSKKDPVVTMHKGPVSQKKVEHGEESASKSRLVTIVHDSSTSSKTEENINEDGATSPDTQIRKKAKPKRVSDKSPVPDTESGKATIEKSERETPAETLSNLDKKSTNAVAENTEIPSKTVDETTLLDQPSDAATRSTFPALASVFAIIGGSILFY